MIFIKYKPRGYWADDTIIGELQEVINEIGHFPIRDELRFLGRTDLLHQIYNHGPNKYRKLMGYDYIQKPDGYWTDETIINELMVIIGNVGYFPTQKEFRKLNRQDLGNAIGKHGGVNKYRKLMGYDILQHSPNYWTEEKVIIELTNISKRIGRFPTQQYLYSIDKADLVNAVYRNGNLNKYQKLIGYEKPKRETVWNKYRVVYEVMELIDLIGRFPTYSEIREYEKAKGISLWKQINIHYSSVLNLQEQIGIPISNYMKYKSELSSYVIKRGKKTEDIIYNIICSYCFKRKLQLPKKNVKLSRGNVIEFVCSNTKRIGVDVTNCRNEKSITEKWKKKDYYKYLDELWIVVVGNCFTDTDYIMWNSKSPQNVYVISVDEFCNELQYDLDEYMKDKINKYKTCTFHTRNRFK